MDTGDTSQHHERRLQTLRLLGALCMLVGLDGCGDDEKTAKIVEPVFVDPCRFFPADGCSGNGQCHANSASEPMCLCNVGYEGASCERCEQGFHADARNRCVTDRSCAEQPVDPCGDHGMCLQESGVITCGCEAEYGGPRCTLCADGYTRDSEDSCVVDTRGPRAVQPRAMDASVTSPADAGLPDATPLDASPLDASPLDASPPDASPPDASLPDASPLDASLPDATPPDAAPQCILVTTKLDFDDQSAWPSSANQCEPTKELVLKGVTLRSRVGASTATVWVCAQNTLQQGLNTKHVELEAAPVETAQLSFVRPISTLSFEYAAGIVALSLDVLADGVVVQVIELPANRKGRATIQLTKPATTVALRSRTLYRQTIAIAIDNIEYQQLQCQ